MFTYDPVAAREVVPFPFVRGPRTKLLLLSYSTTRLSNLRKASGGVKCTVRYLPTRTVTRPQVCPFIGNDDDRGKFKATSPRRAWALTFADTSDTSSQGRTRNGVSCSRFFLGRICTTSSIFCLRPSHSTSRTTKEGTFHPARAAAMATCLPRPR